MTESLEEALEIVAYLPARKRLLVGRGRDAEHVEWYAGSIDERHLLASIEDPSLVLEMRTRTSEFESGDHQATLTILVGQSGLLTMLVLGEWSPERLAEVMRKTAEKAAHAYVTGYLAEKQEVWSRPMAKVLPFRRRPN